MSVIPNSGNGKNSPCPEPPCASESGCGLPLQVAKSTCLTAYDYPTAPFAR